MRVAVSDGLARLVVVMGDANEKAWAYGEPLGPRKAAGNSCGERDIDRSVVIDDVSAWAVPIGT